MSQHVLDGFKFDQFIQDHRRSTPKAVDPAAVFSVSFQLLQVAFEEAQDHTILKRVTAYAPPIREENVAQI